MNDLLATMSAHRSVRAYADVPVPDERIRDAVEAAQMAATSSWVQAYSLIQVTDAGERARLAELTGGQPQVEQAGAFFVVSADSRRHRLVAKRLDKPYADNLETFLLAVIDATLFAQNLNLAFESMGYGTCFIGGLRTRLPEVDTLLEIPHGVYPLFGLCVGVPDPEKPTATRPRLPVDAVWMKDRYLDDEAMWSRIEAHDTVAAEHYAARGLDGRDWTGGLWRKYAKPVREHLHGYYTGKGALLI
ncbi:MAG: nitroreductase family protein [Planctomycetota bacterium]